MLLKPLFLPVSHAMYYVVQPIQFFGYARRYAPFVSHFFNEIIGLYASKLIRNVITDKDD